MLLKRALLSVSSQDASPEQCSNGAFADPMSVRRVVDSILDMVMKCACILDACLIGSFVCSINSCYSLDSQISFFHVAGPLG